MGIFQALQTLLLVIVTQGSDRVVGDTEGLGHCRDGLATI